MRFPLAGWAWPPGPREAAAHDSGVDGRGDGREKGPMQATSGPQRDKTRPAARLDGINRYKTLPAARLGGPPGTKLSLPPGSAAHPVQNSPGTPQNADFGPLFARRENLLPLSPPTTRAGRTLSRMQSRFRYKTVPARGLSGRYRYETLPAHTPDGPTRYKTLPARPARRPTRYKILPARPARRPTRYKILPARPKTLISAHFSPAGRTLYRFRHQHDEQGEKSHAPTPHLSPATCRSPNFACNSIA